MTRFIEPLLLGVGLSMDALAASVALGAAGRREFTGTRIAATAGSFGGFQMLMPILGWGGGAMCGDTLLFLGHYLAPLLLLGIGVNMFREAAARGRDESPGLKFGPGKLLLLSLATSIDAFAVGVSYACRQHVSVVTDAAVIGLVTAAVSACGGLAGRRCGRLLGGRCDMLGGAILAGIAVKVFFWG